MRAKGIGVTKRNMNVNTTDDTRTFPGLKSFGSLVSRSVHGTFFDSPLKLLGKMFCSIDITCRGIEVNVRECCRYTLHKHIRNDNKSNNKKLTTWTSLKLKKHLTLNGSVE